MQKITREVKQDGLIYLLDDKKMTASIIDTENLQQDDNIIIPSSIFHESVKYTVISILEGSFTNTLIFSIQFADFSKFRTIENRAFENSSIESISFPSSLVDLQDGWCIFTEYLNYIKIDSNNPRYSTYDDKFIIGKSSMKQEKYDVLVFCIRNVKTVTIPDFIEIIGPHAFDMCFELEHVIFSDNSKLRIIEKEAFDTCKFKNFKLPPSVECIRYAAFFHCAKLSKVEISSDSKLKTIELGAFADTQINSITIPPSLTNLEYGWCDDTGLLTNINVLPNNPVYKLYDDKFIIGKSSIGEKKYEVLVFCVRNVEKVTIPDFIKIIGPTAFQLCTKLQQISIPSQVIQICDFAFDYCKALQKVEIPTNSDLQYIGKNAFSGTFITNLFIPSKVFNFKECCNDTNFSISLNISPDNLYFITFEDNLIIGKSNINSNEHDELVFANHYIENITIPSFVKYIGPSLFSDCFRLKKVEILLDSELLTIGKNAFKGSKIEHIHIPSCTNVIGECAFGFCKNLHYLDIPQNSELQIIKESAFYSSAIECFYIPPQVTTIEEQVFDCCNMLKIIEFDGNSKIGFIDIDMFDGLEDTLVMVPANLRYIVNLIIGE